MAAVVAALPGCAVGGPSSGGVPKLEETASTTGVAPSGDASAPTTETTDQSSESTPETGASDGTTSGDPSGPHNDFTTGTGFPDLATHTGTGEPGDPFPPAPGCAAQPEGLKLQTVWDSTNAVGGLPPQFSQMGPYFWNEPGTFHVGCDGPYPQFYAIDWFQSADAAVYSTMPGTVTWVGDDDISTLGKYVVVTTTLDGDTYAAIHGHLSQVFVSVGDVIIDSWDLSNPSSLPNVVIGSAGATDVDSGFVHTHVNVFKNPELDAQGRPSGGTSVMPTMMRCFSCGPDEYDVAATDGIAGGFYTEFYSGRQIRY